MNGVKRLTAAQVERDIVGSVGGMYMHAKFMFGDPCEASGRRMRKIRRWICKLYEDRVRKFPDGVAAWFEPEVGDGELMAFLKECYDRQMLYVEERKARFEEDASGLDDDVRAALGVIVDSYEFIDIRECDGGFELAVDEGPTYCRTLRLIGAVASDLESDDQAEKEFTFSDGRYCLRDVFCDGHTGTFRKMEITFADARTDVKVFRVDNVGIDEAPWSLLQSVSFAIVEKSLLPGRYCNSMEEELLPLLCEIANFVNWKFPEQCQRNSFPLLKELFAQYGYDKPLSLIEKMEETASDSRRYEALVRRLTSNLNEAAYERLWRDIHSRIVRSQAEYPSKTEMYCPPELLREVRETVQRTMEEHGFSGTYPDFVKEGELRGIHLEESYMVSYFVGMEKRAVFRVHCFESVADGSFHVNFVCGTALLREGETAEDIYSCLFNAKGRRLFHTFMFSRLLCAEMGSEPFREEPDDIGLCAGIAAKKAQLKRLNKTERKQYSKTSGADLEVFLVFLLFGGGLFGLFMTAGSMLVIFLLMLLFGYIRQFGEVFMSIPWWMILLFCWLGFGIPMGIITISAKRK